MKRSAMTAQPSQSELQFVGRIKSSIAHVRMYADPTLQQAARTVIPVAQLTEKARKVAETLSQVSERDALLLELLHWFKKDFFKWTNKPDCGTCHAKEASMKITGACPPSAEERLGLAGVTEVYSCDMCGNQTRFPRYNDPKTLLTWRQGRCGEWANCFTLCAIALGFDARHIVDWTDHVWTEVWSESQGRWLHCDSCEDKCDIPLIYEAGWGKKLSYVLAFGQNHVVDVSKRYTRKWDEMLQRRTLISEDKLAKILDDFNEAVAASLPENLVPALIERRVQELDELESPPPVNPQGLEGRISGSHDWKVARGETGPADK